MWLGPAPWAPFHHFRCSGSYNINGKSSGARSRDYSGGGMTDWGAHRFGGAMFAADIRDQGPVEVIPPDGKEYKCLTYVFANGLTALSWWTQWPNAGGGIDPIGDGQKIAPKPLPHYKGSGGIYGDFLACVQSRERPFRDIEFAHRTATVCHLGNIAYELKRPLKWDAAKKNSPATKKPIATSTAPSANRGRLAKVVGPPQRMPWQT